MARIKLSKALRESGIAHDIYWADAVTINLPNDHLPFPHQYEGVNLMCTYDRSGLFDEAGTGKTLAMHISALWRIGCGNKVIALMPPVLLKQFYQELFDKFEDVGQYITVEIFRGTPTQRNKMISRYNQEGWPDLLLMTYDLFRGSRKYPGYSDLLKKSDYTMIYADEAQALNNVSSRVHKKVYSFIGGKNTERADAGLVLSTATPSHTKLEQCYGLIKMKTPHAYGTKKEFERLHVEFNPHVEWDEVIGYHNLDVLTVNLYSQARRVEKADVAKDMPPKINTLIPVELEPAHRKLYKKLLDERILELEDKFIDAVQASALRQTALQLVTNPNHYSDKPIKNNMEEALQALLDSINLDEHKVFILAHFNSTIDRLAEILKQYNPATLNSQTRDKDASKEAFLEDDKCRVLIAHPKSGGAGLNLQSVCAYVIFYECPDSPGDITQASERVHRIVGTNGTVNIYFLSPTGTWAANKITKVVDKAMDINSVVGDKKALLADLFDEPF